MSINKDKKGFTLIELLLVIGIISLLSSIFTFNATEARKKANDSKMVQESRQVQTAIQIYKDKNGFVPHSMSASGGNVYTEKDSEYQDSLALLVPDYLSSIPASPDGDSYAYGFSGDFEEGVFIADTNYESYYSSQNIESCSFVIDTLPTSCVWGHIYSPSCSVYLESNPDKICFEQPTSDFCDLYNQDGDFDSGVCLCPIPGSKTSNCGENGGSKSIVPMRGDISAITCNKPPESVCDGTDPNEFCICIE